MVTAAAIFARRAKAHQGMVPCQIDSLFLIDFPYSRYGFLLDCLKLWPCLHQLGLRTDGLYDAVVMQVAQLVRLGRLKLLFLRAIPRLFAATDNATSLEPLFEALDDNTSLEVLGLYNVSQQEKNPDRLLEVLKDHNNNNLWAIREGFLYGIEPSMRSRILYHTDLNRCGRGIAGLVDRKLETLVELLVSVRERVVLPDFMLDSYESNGIGDDNQLSMIYGLLHTSISNWVASAESESKRTIWGVVVEAFDLVHESLVGHAHW